MIKTLYLSSSDPVRAASIFDPSSLQPLPPTMANPTVYPIPVLPTNSYWGYLSRVETETFRERYAAVLAPYSIDPVDAYDAAAPANVAWLIYATSGTQ